MALRRPRDGFIRFVGSACLIETWRSMAGGTIEMRTDDILGEFSKCSILPSISMTCPDMSSETIIRRCIFKYYNGLPTARDVAMQLKIYIELKVFNALLHLGGNRGDHAGKKSGKFNLGKVDYPVFLFTNNVLDYIVDIESVLREACSEYVEKHYCIIPPWVANLIPKDVIRNNRKVVFANGYVGKISGIDMDIFASNCLPNGYIFFGTQCAMLFNIDIGDNVVAYQYGLTVPERFGELHCMQYKGRELR